ncbi:MAG: glycoside hydrolase family 95-like protein, partial [Gemmatimonadota bacterium]
QRDYVYDRLCRYGATGAPTLPFVQCGLEPLGILGAAVNEMLLQSHDGVIRLFPAVPADWECACSLWAAGGFRLSARRGAEGVASRVEIQSGQGGICRVANPWGTGAVTVDEVGATGSGTGGTTAELAGEVLELETRAGGRYLLAPAGPSETDTPLYTGEPNPGPKQFHEAALGRPRDF